jgi:flagella basal body P-ring formation protein FlgA
VFTAQELMRLAKANGITLDGTADEICFEVPVHPLTDREVGDAMRKSLPDGTSVRIVELQKVSVPAGVLEFPLESLEPATPASPSVQLWRGHIRYAESRQMPAWARVEVQARFTAVVALEDIAAGAVIRPGSVRVETRTGSIQREPVAPRVEDVAGRVARRTIRAGAFVPVSALAEAPSVHRGDSVTVEVESGPAHLRFDAIAERAGSKGDLIDLRNPINGKTFRARLGEGARASIVIAGGVR